MGVQGMNGSLEAVQAHLTISQGIIQRMAANSASSKSWCIGLVSAILVVVADKHVPIYMLIAYIPTLLFYVLDSYYLALERCFRRSYNKFIEKIHKDNIEPEDLFVMQPTGSVFWETLSALWSFSTIPFYGVLVIIILIARNVIN